MTWEVEHLSEVGGDGCDGLLELGVVFVVEEGESLRCVHLHVVRGLALVWVWLLVLVVQVVVVLSCIEPLPTEGRKFSSN
jgi:hypothetical protein